MRTPFFTVGMVLLWSARIGLAQPTSTCLPDGVQSSGAKYRICMPSPSSAWNGQLVLFAHGYVVSTNPIAIPEDQLKLPDGTSLPGLINSLGYAFAVSSFRTNGLAVLPAVDDLRDLVDVFHRVVGSTSRVYLTGASEGGLITTLSMERFPEVYNAGLAACGPIGDFPGQINYLGDFRVLFDHYFPGVIPGSPVVIPPAVIANWATLYTPNVAAAVSANPQAAQQVLHVDWAPGGDNPTDTQTTFQDVLWYNVFTTNDAVQKLGGNPYDNRARWYIGSQNDFDLNFKVERVAASPTALANMQAYQTTGKLRRPLVTLHTTGDQIVPYWHELGYGLKVLVSGSIGRLTSIPVARYGHCNFQASDVLLAFVLMVLNDLGQPMSASVANVLPSGQQPDFRARAVQLNAIR
uniref:Peptidase S9 prolyl oligopeptidase catalytic domain-containing protein n=1 Tax=Solibacter usitatus (strain Ellin6076) TaxID=234267 RepID=Q02DB2_SOLUE